MRMNEYVTVKVDAETREDAENRIFEIQDELGLHNYLGHVEAQVTTPESHFVVVFHPDLAGL